MSLILLIFDSRIREETSKEVGEAAGGGNAISEPPRIPVEAFVREWDPEGFQDLLTNARKTLMEGGKEGEEPKLTRKGDWRVLEDMIDKTPEIIAGIKTLQRHE